MRSQNRNFGGLHVHPALLSFLCICVVMASLLHGGWGSALDSQQSRGLILFSRSNSELFAFPFKNPAPVGKACGI